MDLILAQFGTLLYIGMSVYAKTKKRSLVEMLHEHGMSISYDQRVGDISML